MKLKMAKNSRFLLLLCMLLVVLGVSGCAGNLDRQSQLAESKAYGTEASAETTETSNEKEESAWQEEEDSNEKEEESTQSVEDNSDEEESTRPEADSDEHDELSTDHTEETEPEAGVVYGEAYNSKDEVALYIHTYQELPPNYITKKEAQALGWSGGSLEEYAPGKSIGGDKFGNYEGNLPDKKGRKYIECDIDTEGANQRGAKRIVFSNDGLIYYTEDHYESFELLYGEE